jgi:peroxiredoxin Q/BCP
MLKLGDPAPDFALPSTSGDTIALKDLRGEKVVLYFYPRDDTPGCTREACDFRDNIARVAKHGARVLGVSKDKLASHDKFRAKYELPFELLSDADNAVAKKYGAYGEKKLYGKPIVGTIRSTFLIDEKGRIAGVWSPVKVDGHVDAVIAQLSGGAAPSTAPKRAAKKPAPRKRTTPTKSSPRRGAAT